MSSITDTLAALSNPDPSVRVPAEQAVNQAKEADLAGFILAVLQEFQDPNKPPSVRNQAGILLKNAVAPSYREVAARQLLAEKWKQLPAHVRQQVKEQVLATLGSPARDVRNVAANIVGSLSRIELPAGEWQELVGILVGAAQSGCEQYQEASLTAIGYICEEGHDYDDYDEGEKHPLQQHTPSMLGVIVQCMSSTDEDVRFAATRALCTAMDFISNNMENQEQRDYLIGALCQTVSTCPNVRTREMAMEALVKVAELYYNYLPAYIETLSSITTHAIFQDKEEVGLQALQLWTSICETERDFIEEGDMEHSLNYAVQGMSFLVDICLRTMVMQEEAVSLEEDWNLHTAGSYLLQTLAETVGQPIHAPVMDYVFKHINSDNWHEKEAALMAFGCVLGIEDESAKLAIQDTVAQAVPGLLAYLQDSNELVADTAAWVTAVVCEHFVDVFLNQAPRLQQLMNIVGPMTVHKDAMVARRACTIINNLALAFEDDECKPTNELSPFYADIVTNLLHGIDHGNTYGYRSTSQETLNAVVDAAADDCLPCLNSLAPVLLQRLSTNIQYLISAGGQSEELEGMVGLLCGSAGAVARKLGQNYAPYFAQTIEMLLAIINMPVDYVNEEALTAIGSLAYACKDMMAPYIGQVIPYILRALRNYDEPDSQSVVVAAIGDFTLACGQHVRPYVGEIMSVLYNSLVDPNVDRDTKVTLLSCFSDVIVNVLDATSALPYLTTLMPLLDTMFEQSLQIDFRGDPSSEEYVMSLWESTSSVYSCVVQIFKKEEIASLMPYLSGMLRFALHVANNAGEFTGTAVAALTVLGDMANVLNQADPQTRQKAKMALLTPQTKQVLTRVQKLTGLSKEDKKSLRWIDAQLRKLESF